MKPNGVQNWAAISEIVASIAVVISLIFVGVSINRQTTQLQADNVNDLYDALREIDTSLVTDAQLAEIMMLSQQGNYDALTPEQVFRHDRYMMLNTDVWSQAFDRFRDGSLSGKQFAAWDNYYVYFVRTWLPRDSWETIKGVYTAPFQEHVDAVYNEDN